MLSAILGLALAAGAGDTGAPLKISYSPLPPFVIETTPPTGYAISLWSKVAQKLGRPFELVPATGVRQKLEQVRSGAADIAIGGISMTAEREARFDFSFPTAHVDMGILVRSNDSEASVWRTALGVIKRSNTSIAWAFLILIVVAGHLVWFAERGAPMFSDRYKKGVWEGMYWAIVTASTVGYGDKAPVRWFGRVVAAVVIIISLPMFALFTAELSSAFTVEELSSQVASLEDLKHKTVGVIDGTTSAKVASDRGLRVRLAENLDAACEDLSRGETDAVLYDAASLDYHVRTKGAGTLAVAARNIHPQAVGFALATDSALREPINRALLSLEESGDLRRLRKKWLGTN